MSSQSTGSQRAILVPTQLVPPIPTTRTALFVIGGALLALVLGVMDQSIVVTAGPAIIHALPGGLGLYPWVFTAFILAQTISMPILGKLSDMYGRKRFFLAGLVLFMAGSILSGASQSIQQLVIFRAIQGVGSGAFFSIGLAIIGISVTPERRARVLGISGSVLGSGAIFGPTAGSYLVQSVGWRWIFYVNIPLGLAALAIIGITLRETRGQISDRSIDWLGVATLSGWVSLLLLGLLNGGTTYTWISWQEALFFAGFVVLFPMFILAESRAKNPILPLSLFRNRTISASVATQLARGMVFYGGVVYVALFIQGALGGTIDDVRNIVYCFVVPFIIGSIASGRVVNRFGYRAVTMSGLLIAALGALSRVLVGISPTLVEVAITGLPLGLGLGITLASILSAFQNSVDRTKIGIASSLSTFSQNLGGAIGVGIMGTIQLNSLSSRLATVVQQAPASYQGKLAQLFSDSNQVGYILSSSTGLNGSPLASFLPQIRTALAGSVLDASIGLLVISIIAVVASSFVPGRLKKPFSAPLSAGTIQTNQSENALPSRSKPLGNDIDTF